MAALINVLCVKQLKLCHKRGTCKNKYSSFPKFVINNAPVVCVTLRVMLNILIEAL